MLDHVWDYDDDQESVYNMGARERVSWVLEGYNSTVLCYGQTGSGKTYTMFGPEEVAASAESFARSNKAMHGVLPRACSQLFEMMTKSTREVTYVVHVSYVEVYNGECRDLLSPSGKKVLVLRENPKTGLTVEGQTHTLVSSPGEVMRAVMRGNDHRVIAAMKMNERSSRGHALITISVREVSGEGSGRVGKLMLVDLAGMESSKKSCAPPPPHLPIDSRASQHIAAHLSIPSPAWPRAVPSSPEPPCGHVTGTPLKGQATTPRVRRRSRPSTNLSGLSGLSSSG